MSHYKHLTLNERIIIETGIKNNGTKSSIANTIGKDKTTVGKEIKKYRYLKFKTSLLKECANYKKCKHHRVCLDDCVDYVAFKCNRRDRSPGACNGCNNYSKCRFNKFHYDGTSAYNSYKETLIDSRMGVNLTINQARELGLSIKEGLDKGHSIYHIKTNNPNISQSERTLYSYIDSGIFSIVGLNNLDLRRKVSRRYKFKKAPTLKKRSDNKYLIGRKYNDYLKFIEGNDDIKVIEMDTVYNDINGPFIQTFYIRAIKIILAIYQPKKDSDSMVKGFYKFVDMIGINNFYKVCDCILTDRGTEFSNPKAIEADDNGVHYCKVFYCDPMASYQKPNIEKEHVYLRYILPKGYNLNTLGLNSQKDLNLVISHLNSFLRESLNGKSSFEVAKFYYPDIMENLIKKDIFEIPTHDVILKPSLLLNKKK